MVDINDEGIVVRGFGVQPVMTVTTGNGRYAARTTTTANEVFQGGYISVSMPELQRCCCQQWSLRKYCYDGSPFPVEGVRTNSFVLPPIPSLTPPGVVMSNLGGFQPQSPTMVQTRPISPVGFVDGEPPVGFPGTPAINRLSHVFTGDL